ncbi:hypothetical protein AB0I49_10830 [Streptomyces sp. NPDC050617]|uniref:hypothetical protein n=1 Tax=Streptomyces sp. NPDC050617 TaxID=3154628 RepID=UPI003434D1A1
MPPDDPEPVPRLHWGPPPDGGPATTRRLRAAAEGPARPHRRPGWAADPLDELAEELAEVCAAAVHPDEIAAVLEADGMTAEQAAERYGRRDAFELAEDLFAKVPRAYPEPGPRPDPWQAAPWQSLLRAVVFTLPGLGYGLAERFLAAPRERQTASVAALVASALVAWAWNQGLAHRAYGRLASGGRAACGRTLRLGAPLGAVLAFASALAFLAPGGVTAFSAGQALYLGAATVLLVLGGERLLLYCLLPTAAGAALLLLFDLPGAVRAALLLTTVGGALGAAARETVRATRDAPPSAPAAASLAASVPYGLFGLACGVLTTFAALGDRLWYGNGAPASGPVVIALTLSMGAAEWLLYRCRGLSLRALAHSTSTGGLLLRAMRVLAVCLSTYLGALAVLALATTALWPGSPPLTVPRDLALLLLGAVLWTGLLLQALGTAWAPALLCIGAAAGEAVVFTLRSAGPTTAQLALCGGAAAALFAVATAQLGRITTHR